MNIKVRDPFYEYEGIWKVADQGWANALWNIKNQLMAWEAAEAMVPISSYAIERLHFKKYWLKYLLYKRRRKSRFVSEAYFVDQ